MENDKNRLASVSSRYLPDDRMEDPPARIFRAFARAIKLNPYKWTKFLGEYLDWTIKETDPKKEKERRAIRYGNIRDTFWNKPRLTSPMLLEGLSILQMKKCKITYECTDEDGNVYTVVDEIDIKNARNSVGYVPSDDSEET